MPRKPIKRSDLMTMTNETAPPQAPKKPDLTLTTQTNNQTMIMQVFFNNNSKETFEEKLLRVVLAEEMVTS